MVRVYFLLVVHDKKKKHLRNDHISFCCTKLNKKNAQYAPNIVFQRISVIIIILLRVDDNTILLCCRPVIIAFENFVK